MKSANEIGVRKESGRSDNAETTLWTVGHSTRSAQEFHEILVANRIEALVDVRSFPALADIHSSTRSSSPAVWTPLAYSIPTVPNWAVGVGPILTQRTQLGRMLLFERMQITCKAKNSNRELRSCLSSPGKSGPHSCVPRPSGGDAIEALSRIF